MNRFNVGDMVIMTRVPTTEEWRPFGEVEIPPAYLEKPHEVADINKSCGQHGIKIVGDAESFTYPECCFELSHDIAAEEYKKHVRREALLEKARENYPPGTRFYNAHGSISTVGVNPEYILSSSDRGIYVNTTAGYSTSAYIYRLPKNEWAEIVSNASTSSNKNQAKKGDYIKILNGHGNSDLEGKTYYVVNLTHECCFELAKPGNCNNVEEYWTCSDPSYYEIVDSTQVIKTHAPKDYSDNYELPVVYNVGDTVVGRPSASKQYTLTQEGWEGVIAYVHDSGKYFDANSIKDGQPFYGLEFRHFTLKASKSEGPKYTVGLPTLDSKAIERAFSELQTEYFKQIKNQQNGTENQQSVKLQRVNLQIREGNPIRGIGLKSSRSKIKLGGDYSYN